MTPALFLDRDGVINVEKNYVYKIEDFEFIHSVFCICEHFQQKGFKIFIITNQAGIARGYYAEKDFIRLTKWMEGEFLKKGIVITKTYFCPHHPEITGECYWRKPNPGMILQAQKEFNLDLKNSVLIGDKQSDLDAGKNAGIEKNYFVDEFLSIMENLI